MRTDLDPGTVALVGAGPGDPDLLTVRARRLLDAADVIFHDALVTESLLRTLPADAEVVDVGKRSGPDGDRTTQAAINRRLVAAARAGRRVVRLKGGDPFVFGRGAEEAEYLASAGVPITIVPGLSSVLSTGLTGIPLTHRDHASSITVFTGHEDPEKPESALDWSALADTVRAGGTLVVLMGVRRLPSYTRTLRDRGVPADTPVAMVQKASWRDERTITGILETIVDRRDESGIEPPAITLIGDVVSVRSDIVDWLERSADTAPVRDRPAPLAAQLVGGPSSR